MNVYEHVLRKKSRFNTHKGQITAEQVFDLPLQSSHPQHVDLDKVAKQVNRELQDIGDSFVSDKPNPARENLEKNLEFVKAVIETKKAERAEAEKKSELAAERALLQEALHDKQKLARQDMSEEAIRKRLAEIEGK